jgi:hypothetical protein
MSDEGTEADYMYDCQLAASGGDAEQDDPDFEVVNGKNDRLFAGSRAACWDFKRKRGGYVRAFTGFDDVSDWQI